MKFKKLSIFIAIVAAMTVLAFILSACDTTGGSDKDKDDDGIGGGFTEFPLGDDIEFEDEGINVAGVYFQAVDMMPSASAGLSAAEADAHIEADISALAGNELGYGAGDFVPYLNVSYEIWKNNVKLHEGNFMPMNASDGPHYGANVIFGTTKGELGTYTVKFFVQAPGSEYLLHTDSETGVTGRFWTDTLVASWTFDFMGIEAE
ncbi:MAG: iron transporter [Clostridiaceae bacterium]|jgi:uncharacterized protein involved in high-affinity Fe2+ transport|nr:iron transporter [Clostridiaceae bacterium]